ncbi:AAA family ATPase [Bifidobacterium adolescentis]|uniref:AAA family ATPase n=1 Tax=Bifidobacterium adolescentis TaxID=1680 RepID=UPI004063920A
MRELLDGLVAEYKKLDVLTAHNLAPRNRIILTGAPGTGKTTFASILSERLGLDGVILRTDRVISSQLGKTLTNIALVFDRLHMERKLLFIDECDMLLARRDNSHDVAEMRRATNLVLQKIDTLPDDCILVRHPTHSSYRQSNVMHQRGQAQRRQYYERNHATYLLFGIHQAPLRSHKSGWSRYGYSSGIFRTASRIQPFSQIRSK